MRVAIFSDNFYPELSGICDSLAMLARGLARRGHQVAFYVPNYGINDYRIANLGPRDDEWGEKIQIIRLATVPFNAGTNQGRAVIPTGLRWLKVRRFQPDIIYANGFTFTGLEALLAAKILRVPLLGTNHTAITEFLQYSPIKGSWLKKFSLGYVAWFYNRCDFVTAPSQSVIDEMTEVGFKRPSQPISNPVDTKLFEPVDQEKKRELKKKFNFSEQTVLYAGRLAEEKHIDEVIRAIALVKKTFFDVSLAIAGHGIAEASLKKLIKELNVESHVKFLGTLDLPTLAQVYQASDVFAIMSTSETQSLTLMQALATGTPAIGANSRALPEYLKPSGGLIVEPGDYSKLAERIVELFKNQIEADEIGRQETAFAQNFSQEKIIDQWLKIYQTVITNFKNRKS